MDRADPDKRPDGGTRGNDRICPTCDSDSLRAAVILDTRKGKTVRVFKCQCGELIWGDCAVELARQDTLDRQARTVGLVTGIVVLALWTAAALMLAKLLPIS